MTNPMRARRQGADLPVDRLQRRVVLYESAMLRLLKADAVVKRNNCDPDHQMRSAMVEITRVLKIYNPRGIDID